VSTAPKAASEQRSYDDVLADAVRVLTEAARRRNPVLERDEAASQAAGKPVWVPGERTEPADWAEFVCAALAGAAANAGGVEVALAGRPGSWEADGVRDLLTSTVGHDEGYLFQHRTEPVVVQVYVDELIDFQPYEDAQAELDRRADAVADDDSALDAIAGLEGRLVEQQRQDWAAYGEALKAAVLAAAAEVPGLSVPVEVEIDLKTFRFERDDDAVFYGLEQRLLDQAINRTPAPALGNPLERLEAAR
jgi:hypothetical protein